MSSMPAPPYAELHCVSSFSFLRGASQPEELVTRAAELGYEALAITDECSVAGVVRAHLAAKDVNLKLLIGTELRLADGPKLILIAPHRRAYAQMCALISLGRALAPKGRYRLTQAEVEAAVPDCLVILLIGHRTTDQEADWFAEHFGDRGWLGVSQLRDGFDAERLERSARLARRTGLPRLACGDVHMHRRGRRALQDTLTAIRLRTPLPEIGRAVHSNGERHLRARPTLARLYPAALLAETLRLAERCAFSLNELHYEYPEELVPEGHTPASWLRHLTETGAERRWPDGVSEPVRRQLEHELALIAELRYEPYFLTVHDVVRYARDRNILCQGRGSAANSVACYCLGITEVDPARMSMLFERFISRERDEPPDIDVDFEHARREEVIQYVYRKYGRHRAALAATVITYRSRSALRDAGRALGLAEDQVARLTQTAQRWDGGRIDDVRLREAGFDPRNPLLRRVIRMAGALRGFPRHLSQHVGGLVISQGPISELVPTENTAMEGRTVIQWDKDDLESLGLLKVDCLALGILTAIHKGFDLLARHRGRKLTLASVPPEVPAVYEMLSKADTVGVFQVESRAQMAMLPRLRPQCIYDLVIQISLVRPGPIQGDMVHPYLARRMGGEPVTYPSEEVRGVLERTLGVPIFQEQVMRLAAATAGFTPGEADRLRRGMAAWRRRGSLDSFEERLRSGMRGRGYSDKYAERIVHQIQGFGEYGFPESHAASFALLVYVSAWLKRFEPAVFTCALLNSQPMGFYAPAQLVRDAREHGVEVRAVDVTISEWDCALEPAAGDRLALRLGLRLVKGLSAAGGERVVQARAARALRDAQDLARRARLPRRDLKALAEAGALAPLAGHRRNAWWQVLGVEHDLPVFEDVEIKESRSALQAPSESENIAYDYNSIGFSLGRHPLALLRPQLERQRFRTAAALRSVRNKRLVRAAGLVISRQCPSAANGIVFVTLEDETGMVNVVIWRRVVERFRKIVVGARLMGVIGIWERRGEVAHLIAGRLEDHSPLLGELMTRSRDFQ